MYAVQDGEFAPNPVAEVAAGTLEMEPTPSRRATSDTGAADATAPTPDEPDVEPGAEEKVWDM